MTDRLCRNCIYSCMIESPKGMKERYCRMRNGWVGNMLCCSAWEQKANTNADKIRAMTDEELAEFSDKSFLCPPSIHGKCDHIEKVINEYIILP